MGSVGSVEPGFTVVKAIILVSGFIFDEVMSEVTGLVVTGFVVAIEIGIVGRVVSGFTFIEVIGAVSGFIPNEVVSIVAVTGLVVEKVILAEFTVDEVVTILVKGTVGRVVQCFALIILVSGFIFDEVVTSLVANVVT